MCARETVIKLEDVSKSFTMHLRGGTVLPVVRGVDFEVAGGEWVVLARRAVGQRQIVDPEMIYGNYRVDRGRVWLKDAGEWVDVATDPARHVLALRKTTVG